MGEAARPTRLNRRAFVRLSAGAALAVGVQACTPAPAPVPSSAKPAAGGAKTTGAAQPTYVAFQGPPPDLPGTAEGVQPAYFRYPSNQARIFAQPILKGGDVTGIVSTPTPPPPALDQNPTWQEVNRRLGANLRLLVFSSPDYPVKLGTMMAGDDTPDLVYVNQGGPTPAPNLLAWLQAKCMDLTPYLSGDAVKEFANLANMPPYNWKGTGTFYSGKIWGVPCPRPVIANALMVHQEMLDQIGAEAPKSADDLKRILVALTRPNQNIWGWGAQQTSAFNNSGFFAQMFGAPNNWKVDASGKLIKNWETEEFAAGVGYARDLHQAGVFHPNSTTYTAPAADADFSAGRFAFFNSTWTGFSTVFWPLANRLDPNARLRPVAPFSADGTTKPLFYLGVGNFGNTYLKKTTPERAKELIRVLDFLASPFGTEEQMLLTYGIQGTDYTLDDKGNPVASPEGFGSKPVPWRFMTQYPVVTYNAVRSEEFARVVHGGESAMIPPGITDPTYPLYSQTYANSHAILQTDFYSGVTDIITGRRPTADLPSLVTEWRTRGGDKIRTEFEQSLASVNA